MPGGSIRISNQEPFPPSWFFISFITHLICFQSFPNTCHKPRTSKSVQSLSFLSLPHTCTKQPGRHHLFGSFLSPAIGHCTLVYPKLFCEGPLVPPAPLCHNAFMAPEIRNIQRHVLPNGLVVITENMSHVRSVSVGVWIRNGSRREIPQENGIAHFTEHMDFKGTERPSAEDIAREMD